MGPSYGIGPIEGRFLRPFLIGFSPAFLARYLPLVFSEFYPANQIRRWRFEAVEA
jgi:hypothetical protein